MPIDGGRRKTAGWTRKLNKQLKLTTGVIVMLGGLYVVSFYSGTNWFYAGLLAAIWGGGIIGDWLRNRHSD